MDDAAIELERETLLVQKKAINAQLEALPLTAAEQRALDARVAERAADDARRTTCFSIIAFMIIGGFGVALVIVAVSWIYSLVAGCHFPLFGAPQPNDCNSTPLGFAAGFGVIGVFGCAFAAGS
jgi:hypothetical protein